MFIHVVGYGSLYRWLPAGEQGESMPVPEDAKVSDVLRIIGIPPDEVWMVTVNGQKAKTDQVLFEGDEVRLFSPLGGG